MMQVDVMIMGQPYRLACKEGEEDALRDAVRYLDGKMCAIRDAGRIKGNDRIAVMAALGIAAELLATKSPEGAFSGMSILEINQQVAVMHAMLDAALAPQENLF
jgi:cell division protein ZapA